MGNTCTDRMGNTCTDRMGNTCTDTGEYLLRYNGEYLSRHSGEYLYRHNEEYLYIVGNTCIHFAGNLHQKLWRRRHLFRWPPDPGLAHLWDRRRRDAAADWRLPHVWGGRPHQQHRRAGLSHVHHHELPRHHQVQPSSTAAGKFCHHLPSTHNPKHHRVLRMWPCFAHRFRCWCCV